MFPWAATVAALLSAQAGAAGTTSTSTASPVTLALAPVRPPSSEPPAAQPTPAEPSLAAPPDDDSSAVLGATLASAGMTALVLAVGSQAWWDEGLLPFSLRETGFFGKETYAGGADKAGHMFSAYFAFQISSAIYEAVGVRRDSATWIAAAFSFSLFNGFELIDGFTKYGFEYGDVIMNSAGIAFGLAARLSPTLDSIVGLRLGYWPSRDFLANEKSALKLINDYTGMLFYLDLKPKGIFEALGANPGWSRFLLTGLVFGTQKYSPVRVHELRRRSLGIHFGLSLPELLRAAANGDAGMLGLARFFDFYAMPLFSISVMNDLNRGSWYVTFGLGDRAEIGGE